MSFSLRIFLGMLLVVAAALWVSVQSFRRELVPGMRQSVEEVLVDTANLLAVLVEDEVVRGEIDGGEFASRMERFGAREIDALIYDTRKTDASLLVYITDRHGRVIYDSRGEAVGLDYSSWNDVYRTLRGEYGARSTRTDPDDDLSSVMYVAAPIRDGDRIVGVLSVGKPARVVMPFVDAARRSLWTKSAWLLAISLVVAGLVAVGLTRSVRRLTRYADAMRAQRRVRAPRVGERELARLAAAMDSMRTELEGKRYVEQYLHGLTHELKSPLAAIEGAVEILDDDPGPDVRARFVGNIRTESRRLQEIVERLLRLADLESRESLETAEPCRMSGIVRDVVAERAAGAESAGVTVTVDAPRDTTIEGDPFLLRQAIGNLVDNAVEFSPRGGSVDVECREARGAWSVTVRDRGPGIPEYAAERVFDRFYSLPRPDDRPKSTGLGLTATREIADLHHGVVTVENHPGGGAVARLTIPVRQPG